MRRMSPSVMIPVIAPFSITAVTPSLFSDISTMTSLTEAEGETAGFWAWCNISATRNSSFLPNAPPGWYFAKFSAENPRSSIRLTASASPMTSCAVVLLVGARLIGSASESTVVFRMQLAFLAKKDVMLPVIAISGFPKFRISGTSTLISGELPLLEMQITTS